MSKDQPYTLRWTAMQISRLSADPRIDALVIKQIEIISQLLGEPIPKEFPHAPDRPDAQKGKITACENNHPTKWQETMVSQYYYSNGSQAPRERRVSKVLSLRRCHIFYSGQILQRIRGCHQYHFG